MNGNYYKVYDLIEGIEPDSALEERFKRDALEYLESLKPVVPKAVADWYDSITYWSSPIIIKYYENKQSSMPEIVRQWIDRLGETRNIVLYDISRFGYRKEKVSRFIIMTSSDMLMANNYFVVKKGDKAYQLTTDMKNATRFTLTELTQVPKQLQVSWTVKEIIE